MRLTASKLELARECPGAFTRTWSTRRDEFAEAGTARHAVDEAAIARGEVPEALTDRWPGLTWRAEVAYAYDVATGVGRELGVGIGRGYEAFNLSPYEVTGTADVVGLSPDALVIVDKKGYEEVKPAAVNPQVRFLALAAARAYKRDAAEVAIRPEVGPMDVAEVNPWDLPVIHNEVKQTLIDLNTAILDARAGNPVRFEVGRRCRWCDAFDDCPKQKELADSMRTDLVHVRVESMLPFERDEDAAQAFDLLQRIKIMSKRLQGALIMRAKERPFMTSNGMVYGPVEKEGNLEINADVAYSVVREKYGQDVADKAVSREATQTGIERALKEVASRGQLAEMKRAVLKEIEDRGGAKRETKVTIDLHPAPKMLRVVG